MGSFFTIGEQKVRPGVYFRYENYGTPPVAGASDGICAVVLRSNWGKLGEAVLLEGFKDIAKKYGDGGTGGTTDAPYEMFRGGAKLVYAVRLGNGGTKGAYGIQNESGDEVLKLTLLYPGNRQFQLIIRECLDDTETKELLFVQNTEILQTFSFIKGGDEVQNLLDAYAETESDWFTLAKQGVGTGILKIIDQVPIPAGTDPTITNASYSSAFEALEPHRFNCIALDTTDVSVQALLQAYINRIYNDGKFIMCAIGEPTTTALNARLKNAAAFNDYKVVYVGGGFKDSAGKEYNGYLAAARIAGMIAGIPSNESITHMGITGATELTEVLTNSQHAQSINSGMLTFSKSAAGINWIESGINTLVSPGGKEDLGWKKIKRTKVRFELMQRLNDTVEVLVGRINNDPDGRATIIQAAQGVCNTMVAEKKLLSGAKVELDEGNPPKGDSAWFLVYADDIDALEKMYFAFKFRFAPEE